MNDMNQTPNDSAQLNERSLKTLLRSIQNSQGEFSLILVHCNYASLRDRLIPQIQAADPAIQVIHLPETAKTLYAEIQKQMGEWGSDEVMGLRRERDSTTRLSARRTSERDSTERSPNVSVER